MICDNQNTKHELESQIKFLTEKLKEEREKLESESIVIPYDNGGGQSGTRKNPRYEAYSTLMKTYLQTLKYYAEQFADDGDDDETVFDEMIKQFRAVK